MFDRAKEFLLSSFLKPYLECDDITDITYNGEFFHVQLREDGWKKIDLNVEEKEIHDFLRQIANYTEKLFSYTHPILDVSVDKFRINAIHQAIARKGRNRVYNFSIRISSDELLIKNDGRFLPQNINNLIKCLLKSHLSIIISGRSGSGKTEFQKYILSLIDESERVILIDNILELDDNSFKTYKADFSLWQVNENNDESSFDNLIKNALRSSPTFIVIAESRGGEMSAILNSAMSGHPLITTIHSLDAKFTPSRIMHLLNLDLKNISNSDMKADINNHFRFYFHVEQIKEKDKFVRRLKEIIEIDDKGKSHVVYQHKKYMNPLSKCNVSLIERDKEAKQLYEEYLKGISND